MDFSNNQYSVLSSCIDCLSKPNEYRYFDKRFLTYEEFFEDSYYETYHGTYVTDNKEAVEAFGYFGHD